MELNYPINRRQPRGLWNKKCQLNTWHYWKRYGYKTLAVLCDEETAHFVNINNSGKIIDPTWGYGITYVDKIKPIYFVDFNIIGPDEALIKLKDHIASNLNLWQKIKYYFGFLKI